MEFNMIPNKESNFISAIIYVYNNEKEIVKVLENISTVLKSNFKKYEIICVNDASTDGTANKIKEFAKGLQEGILSVINMSYYQGMELAMNAGVDLAIGDFVYEFDDITCDYETGAIMEVYNKCLEGYDIVNATPQTNKTKTSSLFYKVFNRYSQIEYKLQTESFRILSRRAINRVQSINKNIPYRKAVYANSGLKIGSICYCLKQDKKRKFNHQTQKNRKETAIQSLILFTNIGYKFSMSMSILMIITTILVALYTLVVFIKGNPIEGWTTTMLFLAFAFFGLFTIMTIVIKYLEIVMNLIFKKNNYIVKSIDKLG